MVCIYLIGTYVNKIIQYQICGSISLKGTSTPCTKNTEPETGWL